jgi:outer membrane lipoprotein-sorting protein
MRNSDYWINIHFYGGMIMRKVLMFFTLLSIGVFFTACVCTEKGLTVDEIVDRVKKKNDPQGKAETVKAAIFKYSCANKSEKSKITIFIKRPGKLKIVNTKGEEFWVFGYDGNTAWEYTNEKGVRYLNESERNEIRLQAFLLSPSINIKKVFKDIKLTGNAVVDGEECWELVCTPEDVFKSQPIVAFVTKKTYLIVKIVEEQDIENGTVKVVTFFKNYKNYKGFLLPELSITKIDGEFTESTLEKVAINPVVADSEFETPVIFE